MKVAEANLRLARECMKAAESCRYTSAAYFQWLKLLRLFNGACAVLSAILGGVGGWMMLAESNTESVRLLVAACSFLAGLLPAVYTASGVGASLRRYALLAGEMRNLQDAFYRAARVSALKPFAEFEHEVLPLFRRLEKVRSHSLTPPSAVFWLARRKLASEHAVFDLDLEAAEQDPAASVKSGSLAAGPRAHAAAT
jgi:hypothetical protein